MQMVFLHKTKIISNLDICFWTCILSRVISTHITTYHYDETERSWTDAKSFCQSLGMNLTIVRSMAQLEEIKTFLATRRLFSNVWIQVSQESSAKVLFYNNNSCTTSNCCFLMDRVHRYINSTICYQHHSTLCDGSVCLTEIDSKNIELSGKRKWVRYNEVVEYKCTEGFSKIGGNLVRKCTAGGTFSGQDPTCRRARCTIQDVEGATKVHPLTDNVPLGGVVVYTCNNAYRHESGSLVRICNDGGKWIRDPPVCKRKKHPPYKNLGELKKELQVIVKSLKTDKKTTSKYKRSKQSYLEYQTTNVSLGLIFGIIILTLWFGTIVISDVPLMIQHFRYGTNPKY